MRHGARSAGRRRRACAAVAVSIELDGGRQRSSVYALSASDERRRCSAAVSLAGRSGLRGGSSSGLGLGRWGLGHVEPGHSVITKICRGKLRSMTQIFNFRSGHCDWKTADPRWRVARTSLAPHGLAGGVTGLEPVLRDPLHGAGRPLGIAPQAGSPRTRPRERHHFVAGRPAEALAACLAGPDSTAHSGLPSTWLAPKLAFESRSNA